MNTVMSELNLRQKRGKSIMVKVRLKISMDSQVRGTGGIDEEGIDVWPSLVATRALNLINGVVWQRKCLLWLGHSRGLAEPPAA